MQRGVGAGGAPVIDSGTVKVRLLITVGNPKVVHCTITAGFVGYGEKIKTTRRANDATAALGRRGRAPCSRTSTGVSNSFTDDVRI